MKQVIYFSVFLLLVTGCAKKQDTYVWNSGTARTSLNGEPIEFANVETYLACDTCKAVYIRAMQDEHLGYGVPTLSFTKVVLKEGRQEVGPMYILSPNNDTSYTYAKHWENWCRAYYYNSFGDYTDNNYYLMDTTADNFIYIDSYNSSSPRIQARFNLTLVRYKNYTKPGYNTPDTLRFRDGNLDVEILSK